MSWPRLAGCSSTLAVGRPRQWSVGNTVATVGAGALAAGLLTLAYGIATA